MSNQQKQLHVRIPKEIYTKLKVKCAYDGISMQDFIVKLISEYVEGHSAKEKSVLIVDDEAIMRESLMNWLKDSYQVTTAETGEEAIELIKNRDFDVMVLDMRLPTKNGLQVIKEVKEIKPHIKSIIITAFPSVDLAVEAMKEGAVDYLVKPVDPDKLEMLIKQTLRKASIEYL